MKAQRTLASAVLISLLALGFSPVAWAAPETPKAPLATSDSSDATIRGFIVQGADNTLLSQPKFPLGSTFASKSLTWSKGLGELGRTLRLAQPVTKATAAQMILELKASLGTSRIFPDHQYQLQDTQSGATWGIDRVDQTSLPLSGTYTDGYTGLGVDVYIMDTGVNAKHIDFGNRVDSGWTAYTKDSATKDCHGHGTHVAGTAGGATYGVAKEATIIPVKVFSCSGEGAYTSDIVAGINWIIGRHTDDRPAVLNMSLGGEGEDVLMNAAIRDAVAEGVTVVVASGNEADDACFYSPAMEPLAITVNASTKLDNDAYFSNYGSCTDIYAPGLDIVSASHSSTKSSALMSGTSMASPHVAGAAARILSENPDYSPAEVWAEIQELATQIDWQYTEDDADILLTLPSIASAPIPNISGSAAIGSTLQATNTSWPSGATVSYQWFRGSLPIAAANSDSYLVDQADSGQQIFVRVYGVLDGYVVTSQSSAKTAAVASVFTLAPNPTISGTAQVGKTLKAITGTWSPKAKFTYQWLRNGVPIAKATKSSYKLVAADEGATITVAVTGSYRGYATTSRTSVSTNAVAPKSTGR